MPWFNITSLQGDSESLPDLVCYQADCYRATGHRYGPTGRSLMFDTPCAHVPTHVDSEDTHYIYAQNMARCSCGCNGYIAYPEVDWNDSVVNLGDAYDSDGDPVDLPESTEQCARCRMMVNDNSEGAKEFYDADTQTTYRYCSTNCHRRSVVTCHDCDYDYLAVDVVAITTRTGGTIRVCGGCRTNWDLCRHCNHYWNTDSEDECCSDDDGSCGCYECRSERQNRNRVIRNYSYKPDPVFRHIGSERRMVRDAQGVNVDRTPYLGFELEVEVNRSHDRTDVARDLQSALGDVAYLKEDGSISSGFEIVTHPMTLDYALSQFNWAAIRKLRKDGAAYSSDNCGLHVHVSKAGFASPAHEYRWLLFWHRNQVAMKLLAGRDSSYAQYGDEQRSQFMPIVKRSVGYTERYSAINANNQHTYEVRVFASTLFVNRLRAALQLVEATVEYTRHLASSKVMKDGGFSWVEFVEWLTGNARRYADLLERIRSVVKLVNTEPVVTRTEGWGVRNRRTGYVDRWIPQNITVQEKAAF